MKILIACEYSGKVRDAFLSKGHNVVSCDLLPTDVSGPHYQGNIFDIINDNWDMMIVYSSCTYLCNSGAKHLYIDGKKENGIEEKCWQLMRDGVEFFKKLWEVFIEKIVIENLIMMGHAKKIIGYGQI